MTALNGWHRGEEIVRQRLGLDKIPSTALLYERIRNDMPEEHSAFYSTRLQFLPVCILDEDQRPWVSILAGVEDASLQYIQHPKQSALAIKAKLWSGDPFFKYLEAVKSEKSPNLIAGLGIEVSTRRRNKFAGKITKTEVTGDVMNLELEANENLGNCPKYITIRELIPHGSASSIQEDKHDLSEDQRLSNESIALILNADTVFLGTTYSASQEESPLFPSHLGLNHRGGRPGFIRVKPSDGRTLVLPDFPGNRNMTSLGNVEATPLASLTFISFTTGNILYVTGRARNAYGAEARAILPFQNTLTQIYVTGYTLLRNSFPFRQHPGFVIQPSPYVPPVRLLAEEEVLRSSSQHQGPSATLNRIVIHSADIATFEWESSIPLCFDPGQAIIMDFKPFFQSSLYEAMVKDKPSLLNDELIRTWTISSASPLNSESRTFSLTMREKPGGKVTSALFDIVRKLSEDSKLEVLDNSRALALSANIVGINGDFILPNFSPQKASTFGSNKIKNLYWIAGGIGITPFIAMLTALSRFETSPPFKTTLAISTREPHIFIPLLSSALKGGTCPSYLSIHLFTNEDIAGAYSELAINIHKGRLNVSFFEERKAELEEKDTEVFLCGSNPFEKFVLHALAEVGATDLERIHRDNFGY